MDQRAHKDTRSTHVNKKAAQKAARRALLQANSQTQPQLANDHQSPTDAPRFVDATLSDQPAVARATSVFIPLAETQDDARLRAVRSRADTTTYFALLPRDVVELVTAYCLPPWCLFVFGGRCGDDAVTATESLFCGDASWYSDALAAPLPLRLSSFATSVAYDEHSRAEKVLCVGGLVHPHQQSSPHCLALPVEHLLRRARRAHVVGESSSSSPSPSTSSSSSSSASPTPLCWQLSPALSEARIAPAAAAWHDLVFCCGGHERPYVGRVPQSNMYVLKTSECAAQCLRAGESLRGDGRCLTCPPSVARWTELSPLSYARAEPSMCCLHDRLYVFGGMTVSTRRAWVPYASMTTWEWFDCVESRNGAHSEYEFSTNTPHTSVALPSRTAIVLFGGKETKIVDPRVDKPPTARAPPLQPRTGHCSVALDAQDSVLVFGGVGASSSAYGSGDRYDVRADAWEKNILPMMSHRRTSFGCALLVA